MLARSLVVLGALIGIVAALAGYVRYQALDTETFRGTAQELIADQEVRDQIAATLVDELYANVDVAALLQEQLSEDQQAFAAPIAAASRELADRGARRLLDRPRVQEIWVESLARTQERLVRLLEDDTVVAREEGGYLVLDLTPLLDQLGDQVAIVGNLAARLPPDAGVIRLMESGQLETAQEATSILNTLGLWLWVVPFLFFGAAVAVARGRRRIELRAIAIATLVVAALLLLVRALAGRYVVNDLVQSETVRPAAENAWAILTSLLADGAWTIAGVGFMLALGVWLAGPSRSGTASRRFLTPVLASRLVVYSVLALLLFLVVWWGPTAQTRRPLQVLALALLVAVGVEALRRVAIRDFPAAAALAPGEALRLSVVRLRERRTERHRRGELDRLARLQAAGLLDADELAAERVRLKL